ncbi:MAG TPA: flagellar assembly protein A [Clostridia bacterium]|nr:flagellar assembly protein A [Clostridia bacterium]
MSSSNINECKGTIKYSDGHFIITNPENGGQKASISPHPFLIFSVNGRKVEETIFVESSDKIDIVIVPEKSMREFVLEVEPDLLNAYGLIHYKPERTFKLLNSDPTQDFIPELFVEKVVHPNSFSQIEILNELAKNKICFGINADAINSLLKNPGERVLIAEGYDSIDGKDGYIDYPYKTESADPKKNRIDFWRKNTIHSVEKDTVLAIRNPAIQGKEGQNIYGKKIMPNQVEDPILKVGKCVYMTDNGLKILSAIDGEVILNEPFISVEPVHTEYGDVDLSTGHINFVGNVVIHGNVCEGMTIKAGGDVIVYGYVSQGTIKAGGSISIKNRVFSSTIVSGMKLQFLFELNNHLFTLHKFMRNIESMLHQIRKQLPDKSIFESQFGLILSKLISENSSDILDVFLKTEEIFNNHNKDFDLDLSENLSRLIHKYTKSNMSNVNNFQEFIQDILTTEQLSQQLKTQLNSPKNIEIHEAQKSTFTTTGDFIVHGRGCVNCYVKSLGNIFIDKAPGVFRGGEIQFCGEAQILEIGSSGGAITRIETDNHGKIFFSKAYYNSLFKFEHVEKKLDKTQKKGMAFLNKDKLISIINL